MYHFTEDQIENLFIDIIISEHHFERSQIEDPNFPDHINFTHSMMCEAVVEEYKKILKELDLEDVYKKWKEEHTYL